MSTYAVQHYLQDPTRIPVPGNSYVYVKSLQPPASAVYRVPVGGAGAAEALAELPSHGTVWRPIDGSLSVATDRDYGAIWLPRSDANTLPTRNLLTALHSHRIRPSPEDEARRCLVARRYTPCEIYVVDAGASYVDSNRRTHDADSILDSVPPSEASVKVDGWMTITLAVTAISSVIATYGMRHRSITALYIMAHGMQGHMALGMNPPGLAPHTADPFSRLRPYMSAHGRCNLLGCNMASATRPSRPDIFRARHGSLTTGWAVSEITSGVGYRLLHRLAQVLGVPTTGGLDTQWMQANWRFMGTTMTVHPGGNVEVRDQAGALVSR